MTDEERVYSALKAFRKALCTGCVEAASGVKGGRQRIDAICETLTRSGRTVRRIGECHLCHQSRPVTEVKAERAGNSTVAPRTSRAKPSANPHTGGSSVPSNLTVSHHDAPTALSVYASDREFKIVRTRYPWQLGCHVEGFDSRDDVYRFLKPLSTQGWRITNVFESTERNFDWYVHVRRPGEQGNLNVRDLAQTLEKLSPQTPTGSRSRAPKPRELIKSSPPVQEAPTTGSPVISSMYQNIAEDLVEAPLHAPSNGQVPIDFILPAATARWEELITSWERLLAQEMGTAQNKVAVLRVRDQINDVLRTFREEADWIIARAYLEQGLPDALKLLSRDSILPRLREYPDLLDKAIRQAAESEHADLRVRPWEITSPRAVGDVCTLVARAYKELNRLENSLTAFLLAEEDPQYTVSSQDLADRAFVLSELGKWSECQRVTRQAIELGSIPLQAIEGLSICDALSDHEKVNVVELAWDNIRSVDDARELRSALEVTTKIVAGRRPLNGPVLQRHLIAWSEAVVLTDDMHAVWTDVYDWAKKTLSSAYVVELLDFLSATDPEGAGERLMEYLSPLSNRPIKTQVRDETWILARDILTNVGKSPDVIRSLPLASTPPPASRIPMNKFSAISVVLAGATARVRRQVQNILESRWGITRIAEIPSPWEGTVDKSRIQRLVESHDVIVFFTAMTKHSLWDQVDDDGSHRDKFVYPPSGGASGTVHAVEVWLREHPNGPRKSAG